jgi:hypothetical protein
MANGRIYVVEAAFLFYLGEWMEQNCKPNGARTADIRYQLSVCLNGRFASRTAAVSAATICRHEITAMFCWGEVQQAGR